MRGERELGGDSGGAAPVGEERVVSALADADDRVIEEIGRAHV